MKTSIDGAFGGRAVRALATLLVILLCGTARADVINDWNAATQAALAAESRANGVPYYALVHAAMYDAVNAIDGRFAPFAVRPAVVADGASAEAAASAAAYHTLRSVFPQQAAALEAVYTTSLAALPNDAATRDGLALGQQVAADWLTLRGADGSAPLLPLLFGGAASQTSPAATGGPGFVQTASAVSPDAIPRDAAWPASRAQPAAEPAATFYSRILRDLAASRSLPLATNARLFASVYVTQAGAMLACRDPGSFACLGGAFSDALRYFFGTPYVTVTIASAAPGAAARSIDDTRVLIAGLAARSVAAADDALAAQEVARSVARNHFGLVSHR